MWLAGQRGQSGRHRMQVGLDVRGGRRAGGVSVPGVRAGDPVSEMAFDPGQRGVAQPMGGDALRCDQGNRSPIRCHSWS